MSHIPFTKIKYLFCYMDSFPIVKIQIKRFTRDKHHFHFFVGKYCNVDQTHDMSQTFDAPLCSNSQMMLKRPYTHLFCAVNNFYTIAFVYVILLKPSEIVKYTAYIFNQSKSS